MRCKKDIRITGKSIQIQRKPFVGPNFPDGVQELIAIKRSSIGLLLHDSLGHSLTLFFNMVGFHITKIGMQVSMRVNSLVQWTGYTSRALTGRPSPEAYSFTVVSMFLKSHRALAYQLRYLSNSTLIHNMAEFQ